MAHQINFDKRTGKWSFASHSEKAWHGLGQIVDKAMTAEEAIKYANLDYEVAKTDIFFSGSENSMNPIEGIFATYRMDSNDYLGLVRSRYEIVQNKDAFGFFDTIIHEGEAIFETETFKNYVAAGSFISTVEDLNIWNNYFYSGKLLKRKTMKMVETKQNGAVRDHPIFGITEYGYGITVDTKENILQFGQTGFAPGFISMNFYFPKTKTSVIVLENVAYETDDLKKTFCYHTEILKIIRNEIKNYR